VSAAAAKAVAILVREECCRYLWRQRFEVVNITSFIESRDDLVGAASIASKLLTVLKRRPMGSRIGGWGQEESDDLTARLETLCTVAAKWKMVLRRGRGRPVADFRRHTLEENIAAVLMRDDVTVTKAKAGTFALVLEQVHSAVGISERDVHKSVRRAHSALKKAQN
jgi:hypothetical protein